ncbi:MAG: polysaccharide deacetylase family protein [Myxococcales bacterium]|nr:polysaccharide deacetylase family protein [Myxococcales bacterium]
MSNGSGRFVISLDFELHWGVRDHSTVDQYRENLLGVREAIPAMLDLFRRYEARATWACVGMLYAENKRQLLDWIPAQKPRYRDATLSPYEAIEREVGEDEASDPFHYAPSLLRMIAATPGQELGTHTFSHFYCLEEGQTAEDFEEDLRAARRASEGFHDAPKSIVFPRNQLNPAYREVLARCGITAMRGNGAHWAYEARPYAQESALRRAMRLADAYLPLVATTREVPSSRGSGPVDVPASVFFRPFNRRLARAEPVRLLRIEAAMTRAAREGALFHLWWHPHNFGVNLQENLANLARVLEHARALDRRYGFASSTMADAAN